MKKLFPLLIFISTAARAQWLQTGGFVNTKAKTFLVLDENLTIEAGTMNNKSKIECSTLDQKPAANLLGNAYFYIRKDFLGKGSITGTLNFVMMGNLESSIEIGASPIYRLWLQKDAGQNQIVRLASPVSVTSQLRFAKPGSKIRLDSFDLTLLPACKISGATKLSYVLTTGTGRLMKKNLGQTSFQFPVGATATTYNPFIISNLGTVDEVGVRCLPDVLQNGNSGNPFSNDAVAASWEISETVPGGSVFNLAAGWYVGDELAGFTRNNCALRRWDGSVWDAAPLGSYINANPYQRVRNGVASPGIFAVLDVSIPISTVEDRNENGEKFEMTLSPNPASDVLQIHLSDVVLSQTIEIQLFDVRGELVFQQKFVGQNEVSLNIGQLPPGNYFVKIFGENESLGGQFLKI